jgi:hypothetical protein
MLWERRGGEGRDGVFEKDRNAVGRLNSYSIWMWWEYTQDHLHSCNETCPLLWSRYI